MALSAYAIQITRANLWAIRSEHPHFEEVTFHKWIESHGETGYFIRDERSPSFDCQYMDVDVFAQIYMFENGRGELFRKIVKI